MDAATVHLASAESNGTVLEAAREVLTRHGLGHATIQVDPADQSTPATRN